MSAVLSPAEEAWLAESCAESGVPVTITDPVLIDRVGSLLQSGGDR